LRDECAETASILAELNSDAVCHVRRVLYRRAESSRNNAVKAPRLSSIQKDCSSDWPHVTVVVPTRDRADLLRTCLHGLRQLTDYPNYSVIVVDNDTIDADALELLAEIRGEANFSVLECPGKFNFSALSNKGAAQSSSEILLFLNNDVSMIHSDWLKPMVQWAIRPDVGAVGAKLKYPRGGLQHAGVIMSVGGLCLHKYRGASAHDCGYLEQLKHPHEVAAVTGACLAVERRKFEAIGGFDDENLPVDLNDIDLCLRLAARGWRSIWTPEAELYHRESASRGHQDPIHYRKERVYFRQRWHDIVRNDPFFHPALTPFTPQHGLLG
jgi:GT2 family glycosyltransferase